SRMNALGFAYGGAGAAAVVEPRRLDAAWPAISCAVSSAPSLARNAVIPVARRTWLPRPGGSMPMRGVPLDQRKLEAVKPRLSPKHELVDVLLSGSLW